MTPTLGQIVLFRDVDANENEPEAAIVTWVWSEDCVNLTVFDPSGAPKNATSVTPYRRDDAHPWGWELRDEDKGKIGS